MARVKLIIPHHILTSVSIAVRITDINYGNHVGNDSFVSILHEARLQWLKQHGYTELNIGNAGLIMSDLEMEYKKEAFYGDIIEVQISVGLITTFGFELYYQLFTTRKAKQLLLAKAKTGMVCYDYTNKKLVAMPNLFLQLLTNC